MNFPKLIANWKMNGSSKLVKEWLEEAQDIIPKDSQTKCLFCPPVCYISDASKLISRTDSDLLLGAQDIDAHSSKSLTGGISGSMLSDLGCTFVIIGHSERRINFKEKEIIIEKLKSALSSNINVIYCVGEDSSEKELGNTTKKIIDQLSVLKGLNPKNLMIAYEPIWAIGTGNNASSEYIRDVHSVIKNELENLLSSNTDIPIAYGGSIDTSNVETIVKTQYVDGLLIGGASLKAAEFSEIAKISLNF